MLCLGIESSCDETALAIVQDGTLRASLLATQAEIHALFGGVVPEIASREHYRFIGMLYDALFQKANLSPTDIDCYAVSRGPGLLGALLVGVGFAKGLALAANKPLIGINHLHAHLLAAGLEQELIFPALGVLVSGGHTHLYRIESVENFILLGRTLDDAAGEAFDKVAKMLHLPYPGGHLLDTLAQKGQSNKKLFPRPYTHNDTLDFSFSGLKTAVSTYIAQHSEIIPKSAEDALNSTVLCNMCASFNTAVVDTLCIKAKRALAQHTDIHTLILAGGVAANSLLRQNMQQLMQIREGRCIVPSPALCTDNAAMVAYTGWLYTKAGLYHNLDFEAVPRGRTVPTDYQNIG